jgi:ribosome-binding protein aMBF1 (putative translation factor)
MACSLKSIDKRNQHFNISESFLNYCADAAAHRANLEQEGNLEQLEILEKIGKWVMTQRVQRGESRQACAQQLGIHPFDLMAVENSVCKPELAFELANKLQISE